MTDETQAPPPSTESTPAPAPATETPSSTVVETPEPASTFKFEDIDLDEDVPEEPSAPPASPPTEITETPKPAVEATPAVVQPAAETKPTTPEAPKEPPPDSGKQLADHRAKMIPELEKKYTFSDADKAAYLKDPTGYLAKAAAEMHYDVFMSMWQAFQAVLPQMLDQHQTRARSDQERENAFYTMWPKLKGKDDQVKRSVILYRTTNPQASEDEIIKQSGLHAMLALGINPQEAATPPNGSGTTPPTRPAGVGSPGGSKPAGSSPKDQNLFADIASHVLSGEWTG
jgi:hypothetical protein